MRSVAIPGKKPRKREKAIKSLFARNKPELSEKLKFRTPAANFRGRPKERSLPRKTQADLSECGTATGRGLHPPFSFRHFGSSRIRANGSSALMPTADANPAGATLSDAESLASLEGVRGARFAAFRAGVGPGRDAESSVFLGSAAASEFFAKLVDRLLSLRERQERGRAPVGRASRDIQFFAAQA